MSAPELSPSIEPSRILVVDDELDIREGLETLLKLEGYKVDLAANGGEGIRKMESRAYDMVLLDLMMPDRSGMDVLREVRGRDRETPIFMITAYGSVEAAVEALKLGANDYFPKPWDNEKLLIEIERMISKRRLEYENTHLKRALKQRYSFPNIIGKSDRMLRLLDLVGQVASSRSTILITGETGTGKELIAKAIHTNSPRADRMFVPVNSGTLPADLLESTLFGHVKGAFTSAIHTKKGYFEVADRGTIFFDEIGTVSPDMQAKLLRVIQEKEFIPLGATEPVRVDVRILAATNDDLEEARRRRHLPRGPVLPAERDQHRAAAAARAQGRYPRAGQSLLHQVLPRKREVSGRAWPLRPALPTGSDADPDGAQLARQCARAGERRGARRGAGRRPDRAAGGASRSSAAVERHPPAPRETETRYPPMHRSSRSWPTSSGASFWSGWSSITAARPKPPPVCTCPSRRSIRRSSGWISKSPRSPNSRNSCGSGCQPAGRLLIGLFRLASGPRIVTVQAHWRAGFSRRGASAPLAAAHHLGGEGSTTGARPGKRTGT